MAGHFAEYVKQHYEKVRHLPAKERMKALGVMYRKGDTSSKAHGGKFMSKSEAEGGGFFKDLAKKAVKHVVEHVSKDPVGFAKQAFDYGKKGAEAYKERDWSKLFGGKLALSPAALHSSVPVSRQVNDSRTPTERQVMGMRMVDSGTQQGVGMISSNNMRTGNGARFAHGGVFSGGALAATPASPKGKVLITKAEAQKHILKTHSVLKKFAEGKHLTKPQQKYLGSFARDYLKEKKENKPGVVAAVVAAAKGQGKNITFQKAKTAIATGGGFVDDVEDFGKGVWDGIKDVGSWVLSAAESVGKFAEDNPELVEEAALAFA